MRSMSTPAESCRSGADGRAGLPGQGGGRSPAFGVSLRAPGAIVALGTRRAAPLGGPAGAGIADKEGELDMLWPPVRCGGKDRGLPPVGRVDAQLGLLLALGVLGIVIAALLVIVPALLLRMLAWVGAAVLGGPAAPAIIATGATTLPNT